MVSYRSVQELAKTHTLQCGLFPVPFTSDSQVAPRVQLEAGHPLRHCLWFHSRHHAYPSG